MQCPTVSARHNLPFRFFRFVEAAEPSVNVEALRSASEMSGSRLSDERLRVVAPVLKNRLARLQTLRDFEVDDAIAPRHGVRR